MKQRLPIVIVILLAGGVVWAQEKTEPKSEPKPEPKKVVVAKVPDVLPNAVDPYVPAVERARFFRAAGKDNELTPKEFAADRKHISPFVRTFDHWPMLIGFDKNGNKKVDWFEAEAYRREVRRKVFEAFDKGKDRRLRGAERTAANEALTSEKFLAARLGRGGPTAPLLGGRYGKRLIQRYDRDKDGQISDDERQRAFADMRERGRQRMLAEYDTNEDGELDADERRAMHDDRARPWKEKIREWQLRDYDLNGDGELDEEETADLKLAEAKFKETMMDIGKSVRLRMTDLDGDGEVSSEEQRAVREQWRQGGMMFKALARFSKYVDADGDGSASPEEWLAFRDRASASVMQWMDAYGLKYDANDDGRLDEGERGKLMQGIRDDVEHRLTKYDANKDGHIEPDEALDIAEGFLDEIGLRPKRKDDDKDR